MAASANTEPIMDDQRIEPLARYAAERQHRAAALDRACKICGADSRVIDTLDFNKICGAPTAYFENTKIGVGVEYRRCLRCGFIFTEFFDEFTRDLWVTFVYNSDYYSSIDPEYKSIRPRQKSYQLRCLLRSPNARWVGLDYGGGAGLLSQLMRESGYVFDSYDPFGANTTQEVNWGKYNMCTLFEVAEHAVDPIGVLGEIVRISSPARLGVLVGTEIHDRQHLQPGHLANWWYAAPRNGHVSLFSRASLVRLAGSHSLSYSGLSRGIHFFYRGYSPLEARRMLLMGKLRARVGRILRGKR
jgi:hypothetical protein